jgi:predicted alpha-1,2-mannosidase
MITKRSLIGSFSRSFEIITLVIILGSAALACTPISASSPEHFGPTSYVDPFIGTGGHGHTYPGATMPFGMVQLSPDTRLTGWDGCSAYHFSDDVVYGFSHTHLSGTGCSDYGDILFMPTVGEVMLERGGPDDTSTGYCSRFSHERESASPGCYSVTLDDYGILVELTATRRVGVHRYTYPETEAANIIIDLAHRDDVISSGIHFISDTEVEGFRRSRAWAEDQHVYFYARFSKPFSREGITIGGKLQEGATQAMGKDVKAFVGFETTKGEEIVVEVALSAVDTEGARKNLEAEAPGWDFDAIQSDAQRAWDESLAKIEIDGGTEEQRTVFYTALYHAMIAPNLYMDVDGRYRGMDLEVHEADGYEHYTVFSLWDTYRAEHPLFTIIEPERTVDFLQTFISQYEQGGLLPVWELGANETFCMIGYHAVPVIADAYIKGIGGFDVEKAYEAMKHSATRDHFGLAAYRRYGFIPAGSEGESVSKTLEYAYDDWCIAQVALKLGMDEDYAEYIQRAQSYKNIFDPETGFMRARMNGGFYDPFDPAEVNFNYTEANSWQYSFYVPQDVEGLIGLMGGRKRFIKKLDELFETSSELTGRGQADITGMIGQYAHGNEPSHHMAYLYSYAGEPWKTQEMARRIMDELYTGGPAGLCGNEDCGQMSAWYVLGALGFYPVTPGSDIYVIGSPIFERAVIDVGNDKSFSVRAENASPENIYIRSAMLNGERYEKSYITHGDITAGGELVFEMSPKPNKKWGSGIDERPSTSIDDYHITPAPFVSKGERVFRGEMRVELSCLDDKAEIFYSVAPLTSGGEARGENGEVQNDPATPQRDDLIRYRKAITITESSRLDFCAFKADAPRSALVRARFNRIPEGLDIELETDYSRMYTGGGDLSLIDGVRGGDDFRTGAWQGYQGVDLVAVVDLGSVRPVSGVAIRFLQDQNSWIFMPTAVEFSISRDGKDYVGLGSVPNTVPDDYDGAILKDFKKENIGAEARYVRVRARNIGICPDWHKGAGHKAWIFADEIVIE